MRTILLFLCFLALTLSCTNSQQSEDTGNAELPNIILLMGDDHGWDEVGYNGHPFVKTPVLDEMAATGMRFDRFYSGHPSCSPTRGSFLTGRHPNRYGTFAPNWSMRPEEISMAHLMNLAGYRSAHFGKWHVGPIKKESPTSPGAMGFDEWLSHDNFFEIDPILSRNGEEPQKIEGESSKILIDETIRFIENNKANQQPFMTVVWFGSPHEPYSGLPDDLALYENLPDSLNDYKVGLTSNETGKHVKRPLGDVLKERYAEITAMDRAIGELRTYLEENNLKENTLLLYCGDNGTPSSARRTGMTIREDKGSLYEGGILVPGVIEWPATIREPVVNKNIAVTSDLLPTLAEITGQELPDRPIDGISLLPYLKDPEKEREEPICFWKFNAGQAFGDNPELYIEKELQEGTTPLKKMMNGKYTRTFRNYVYPEVSENDFGGERAIVSNRFKLVLDGKTPNDQGYELYDLQNDRAEKVNVADDYPDVVDKMRKQMRIWQESVLNSLTGADYAEEGENDPAERAFRATEKYNILWLTCEDISPTLSFYGDSTAITPNLDKLANESMVYTNAFTTVGVCAPSRSSIITGMHPASIGTMHMRTAHDYAGWGDREYPEKTNATDVEGQPIRQYSAVVPALVKCFTEYLRAEGYYCTNNAKTDYQFAAPVTAWDANSHKAEYENAPEGKPFFSVYNHEVTHESRMWMNKKLDQTVSPDAVPLPDYFPENQIVRQDVARNYSNIEILDKQIGEKIAKLKEAGLYDKTIIFFFSDHGGPLPRGKREVYDSGLKVPFMVRFPNGEHAGQIDDLISFVDLAPTVLSLVGVEPPEYLQGQAFLGKYKAPKPRKYIFGSGDRFDDFSDRIRIVRDKRYLFVKNYYPERPAYKDVAYRKNMDMMNELLRLREADELSGPTAYWFRSTKTAEEFYDCETDPLNLNNLIDDPQYADKVAEMRKALDEHIKNIDDKAEIPEAQMIEQMWPGGVQPQTAIPEVSLQSGSIQLTCSTSGSSIGYILSEKQIAPDLDSGWQLYHKTIEPGEAQFLYVLGTRIGYADSDVVEKQLR